MSGDLRVTGSLSLESGISGCGMFIVMSRSCDVLGPAQLVPLWRKRIPSLSSPWWLRLEQPACASSPSWPPSPSSPPAAAVVGERRERRDGVEGGGKGGREEMGRREEGTDRRKRT